MDTYLIFVRNIEGHIAPQHTVTLNFTNVMKPKLVSEEPINIQENITVRKHFSHKTKAFAKETEPQFITFSVLSVSKCTDLKMHMDSHGLMLPIK